MKVIWKYLDDTIHQIKLGYLILAVDNLDQRAKEDEVLGVICKLKRFGVLTLHFYGHLVTI